MRPLIGYRRDPDGTVVATGLGGYVYNLIVESLMIKHVVQVPEEQIYAGTFQTEVGLAAWEGSAATTKGVQFPDKYEFVFEADLALGPILPTISRFEVAQPLPQYYFIHLTLCGGTKRLYKTDVFAYVTALDSQARASFSCAFCSSKQVWATLITSMLFLAILLTIPLAGGRSRLRIFTDQLISLIGNLFFEATPAPPEDSYSRWLISFWWIVVMVVMTGFTGIMKASMMVKDQTGRINTLQDVMARPEVRPLVISGSTYERLFSTSTRPDYQRLWRQVQRWKAVAPPSWVLSKPAFDMLLEEKAIFFCDDILLYWTVARLYPNGFEGEFYMGTDYFLNNEFTMFVRRALDKELTKKIHLRLRWLWEAGLPQEWKRSAMESVRKSASTQATDVAAMKLTDVGAIFYLMLFGQALACIVVLFEVFAGRLLPAASRALGQRSRQGEHTSGGGNSLPVSVVQTGQRMSALGASSQVAVVIGGPRLRLINPHSYPSSKCPECPARGTAEHLLWSCSAFDTIRERTLHSLGGNRPGTLQECLDPPSHIGPKDSLQLWRAFLDFFREKEEPGPLFAEPTSGKLHFEEEESTGPPPPPP
ncbi:hypothetical protein HPB49_020408 [Dermacentor silvarum]|uniref:Uncharacterized protein n=1 Tax=Dermacentor silvarum TaxID=543639 RepID=A0ACB8CMH6_DERSI|nr:hypothetical protein HPB49_020408 [Dermacentor silvarum]